MKGCLVVFWIVVAVISYIMGSLVNSPCKKTSDWSKYVIRFPANHTIYITKHVIEDGFQGLLSPALGCSVSDAVYCGVELPTNNTISLKKRDILESAVNICNGQTECTLSKKYFLDAEAAVKKLCDASKRPELQRASFRQSIDYECIQDSQIIAMCLLENEIRHSTQPVYLKASEENCSCNLTGSVTLIKILQTISVKLMIQSNDSNIFENPHTDDGLYGVDFPVEAENPRIKIVMESNSSLALMKILSKENISIQCSKDRKPGPGSGQSRENSTRELQMSSSSATGQYLEDTNSIHKNISEMTVATMQLFTNATSIHHDDMDGILSIVKSWIQSLNVILFVLVLLVIFLLIFSFIRQRKDRNMLVTILQKLDNRPSYTLKQNVSAELSHSRLSEDDKNYQEISNQFLSHPNTKRLTNPVYEAESMVLENAGVEQNDEGAKMASLESNGTRSMLMNSDPNGVYELQKII